MFAETCIIFGLFHQRPTKFFNIKRIFSQFFTFEINHTGVFPLSALHAGLVYRRSISPPPPIFLRRRIPLGDERGPKSTAGWAEEESPLACKPGIKISGRRGDPVYANCCGDAPSEDGKSTTT